MSARASRDKVKVKVSGRELVLTNLEKPIWPQDALVKADLIEYFAEMAEFILPYLRGRPLSVARYPDGIDGDWFYQKNIPGHAPEWIPTYKHRGEDGEITEFILAEEPATLTWLGNEAAIELHPWLSTVAHPDRPDIMVFDLDPDSPSGFEESRIVGLKVGEVLERVGIRGFPKTSGATGLHVYVPIHPRHSHSDVTRFAEAVARVVAEELPDMVTLERSTQKREGKVYLDYLQNARGRTMVSPYSPRPRPQAPVSTPLDWSELLAPLDPSAFNMRTIGRRVRARGDPWAGFNEPATRHVLPPA